MKADDAEFFTDEIWQREYAWMGVTIVEHPVCIAGLQALAMALDESMLEV